MKHVLWDRLDLPQECGPKETVLELLGDRRVLLENHHGVCGYDRGMIQVRTSHGVVRITGNNLTMTVMTKYQLIVSGRICAITLGPEG